MRHQPAHDTSSQQQPQKSEKTVQFDLPTPVPSPELTRERPRKIDDDEAYEMINSDDDPPEGRHRTKIPRPRQYDDYDDYDDDDQDHREDRRPRSHRRSHRRSHSRSRSNSRTRSGSPSSISSGETIELPPRFDPNGRPVAQRGEDPLADTVEDFLAGRSSAGKIFQKFTGDFLGPGDAGGGRSSGKRR